MALRRPIALARVILAGTAFLVAVACQDPAGPNLLSATFTSLGACSAGSATVTSSVAGGALTVRYQFVAPQGTYTFSSGGVVLPGASPRALRVTTQAVSSASGTSVANCAAYSVIVPSLASGSYRMKVIHLIGGVPSDSTSETSITIP